MQLLAHIAHGSSVVYNSQLLRFVIFNFFAASLIHKISACAVGSILDLTLL